MELWQNTFNKALVENENNSAFFEHQKRAYADLLKNLSHYNEKLTESVLVPVCNRVLMKGKLIHTNEILVSLGNNYFVKTSSKDAQDICRRRLTKTEEILSDLKKEKEFINNQIEFSYRNILSQDCKEIIEEYNEEEEKHWRKKHRESIKAEKKKEMESSKTIDGEALLNRLEALELQEEMESAQQSITNEITKSQFKSKESALRIKLDELRQKRKTKCVTEDDISKRLDELDEEEELEDELDRLYEDNEVERNESDVDSSESEDNIISYVDEDGQKIENTQMGDSIKPKRRVSFADEEMTKDTLMPNTININFTHDKTAVDIKTKSDKIESPSDIYTFFSDLGKKQKSIIKNCHRVKEETHNLSDTPVVIDDNIDVVPRKQIVIGDVIEHQQEFEHNNLMDPSNDSEKRPLSKFKSMRLAQKKSTN